MLAPPKPLLRAGVHFLSGRTTRKLRSPKSSLPAQEKTFRELVATLARCAFGRDNGVHARMSYPQFQSKVPLRTYEAFGGYIDRMKRGEADVLWPGQCAHYAVSSGTTAGRTKYLPITTAMLAHFRKAGLDSLLYYTARTGSTSVFRGKHLFLGGSTTLAPLEESKPFIAYGGDLSGITALNLPAWAEKHLYEPGAAIAQIADWPAKIDAIVERTLKTDITLVGGIPSWILILAEALRERAARGGSGARPTSLRDIWPNLECLIHGGVPIGPYVDELRAALGPDVNFHEVYPASEGFIATQDADASLGLRLMTDVGLFFEFLPLAHFDEARLAELGGQTLPLEAVRAGVDYALVLTTPAGLCRYVIGDVVRFISTDVPRLIYVGRTKLQLSAFGEHVIEKELTDALLTVSQRHRASIVHFHAAPSFVNSATGQNRGRHEWWIELKPAPGVGEASFAAPTSSSTPSPSAPSRDPSSAFASLPSADALARELDAELIRLNDDYEAKRKGGGLEPPLVHVVAPGFFERWLREKGKWGGQNKMPRCRSDRQIADELDEIVRRPA